jgi:hypothetical protein
MCPILDGYGLQKYIRIEIDMHIKYELLILAFIL